MIEEPTLVVRAKMNQRRWSILRFVDRFCRKNPYCPDTREIMDAVGISSTSVTHFYIDPMREAGLLDCLVLPSGNMAPRTLHVTDLGRELLAQQYPKTEGGDIDER